MTWIYLEAVSRNKTAEMLSIYAIKYLIYQVEPLMLARHLTSRISDIMLHMMSINGPMHLHLTLQRINDIYAIGSLT